MTRDKPSVIVTGVDWMGGGVGSIESAMWRLFREAKQEILLTVYTITSSADMLFNWLETALSRGVSIRMIVNRLEDQMPVVIGRLRQLENTYPHFHLFTFTAEEYVDLHAKLIVVDRQKAIVGSSNLSRRGLSTNYELALIVEGKTASEIASVVDRLIASLN